MTIAAFRKVLVASALGPGATWRKADFHVHIPASSDYEYKGADAYPLMGQALTSTRCAYAIVLKHQEIPTREEIQKLKAHCPNTTLIPGAEINVFVDALFKKIGKDYYFHCIVAIDPDAPGDYGYVLRKAQDELTYKPGEYPAGFRSSIPDVARFFRSNGALFIPAHLHQAKAPEASRSIDDLYDDDTFLGFVRDGLFDALEVRKPSTAEFFDGHHTTQAGAPIPRCVCVISTDSHHHEHMLKRNKGTWVRIEKPTFHELAAALRFPHRVSLDEPAVKHPRILGLRVNGAFIPDSSFTLNEGLNALIGAKGSGKTALLECLRFVLNTAVPAERSDSVKRHLGHILGSAGHVECLAALENGDEVLISRRADSPDRITVTDSTGQSRSLTGADGPVFPISILGWHEIEAVADKAAARIALLDQIGDPAEIAGFRKQIHDQIEKARDLLPLLQRHLKKLDASLKVLWDLQKKRSTLTRLQEGALLSLQQEYEWYLLTEQRLTSLRDSVIKRQAAVPDLVASRLTADLPDHPGNAPAAYLSTVKAALTANVTYEGRSASELHAGVTEITTAVNDASTQLAASFATFRDSTYTPKVNALPPEDREVLAKQIQILEETKRLPVIERQCRELLAVLHDQARQLETYCEAVCSTRATIVDAREKLVAALNSDLHGVRLRFLRSSNHEARDRFQSRFGAETSALLNHLQGFGSADTYDNLQAFFRKLGALDITQAAWEVQDIFWDARFIEFLDVLDEDDVELSLEVGQAGFVPIQNLSAGQRCVAVFPLLLRNSRGPLVIDQPEDNLDNRHIADAIAPDLLKRKSAQQFLVTSHNANLVVLTDADLIVHVDSNGTVCSYPASGFLSCEFSSVKKSVLDVLDGGESALRARQRKYGFKAEKF